MSTDGAQGQAGDGRDEPVDFFDSAGLSCQLVYHISGLESAGQLLFQLVREKLPLSRLNAVCVAPDLSVLIPVLDTESSGTHEVKQCPAGKPPPFLCPDSDPRRVLRLDDLDEARRNFLRHYPATDDLPFVGQESLLRVPLFSKGSFIFLLQFWSRRKGAFPADRADDLVRLTRPLAEALQSGFTEPAGLAAEAGCRPVGGYERLCLCDGLTELRNAVERVAPTKTTVLVLGETGAGKEIVAEALHELSGRQDKPFIRVNCGALAETLVDSELFGHEKGAFTGACARRCGYLEAADGGTLFLDEVGELSLASQVKLLRVLDTGTFQRVGSASSLALNVRLVAATNRDLAAMVRTGSFRQDLYYRLTAFPLRVPPLRERTRDIPVLVRHFVALKARELDVFPSPDVDDKALAPLYPHDWPGNVRELEHVVERALINARGRTLTSRLVFEPDTEAGPGPAATFRPPSVGNGENAIEKNTQDGDEPDALFEKLGWPSLERLTDLYVQAALRRCDGRLGGSRGASSLLGIHYTTLRARLRKRRDVAETRPASSNREHSS